MEASAHDDEMLALSLHDVVDSERRMSSKPRTATAASFETLSHENPRSSEPHLSMPLTLPTSPSLLPLGSSLSTTSCLHRHQQLSVQQYFQTENSNTGDFHTEMQKSNDEYRYLTDAINLNVPTGTSSTRGRLVHEGPGVTHPRKGKKRKQGSNVSIDLQTKIRLIEVAEQYQYDPKSSSRSKQEGGMATPQCKEVVNGIRLAEQFGLNKSTVSRILKRKEEFKKAYYKDNVSGCSKHINKKSKFDKLNRLVENWFEMNREKNDTITDTLIRDVGKQYAQELGIEDFRGSNGWVRSLRNRKQHTTRNGLTIEAQEVEKRKKDHEAIERMRRIFPNGVKDMAGFFKDLSTYLENDGADMGSSNGVNGNLFAKNNDSARDAVVVVTGASYTAINSNNVSNIDDGATTNEFLKKKMIDSLRLWSQELMACELDKLKKRMKPAFL
ncbi:hypothetical protein CCR75_006978 [Bremia lactucae]|uniref:HTH CENPB-type domain-containing protein n=1 Tax=Bremia lactucae TaxID=4779 RepID=A0A976FLG2_BRELC|nr:hypothetical protein CCR75_006978 [Bremia lactucae]